MFSRSIRPVLSFYVSDVEIAEAVLRDADVLLGSLNDRPIYDMTAAVYSDKAHEIFLFLQDHRHFLDMEGRFPLSVGIYHEMMNTLDEEMRRSYSAGGALVGDICRLLPQFIDTLNDELGSSISQGVRDTSRVFNARHPKTELKRVHHNILGILDEAVSYVNMHRDSFNPRELMSILSAAPQALAILAEGMRDIDFEVAGELRSIGRHIADMVADLRSGASDVGLDYLIGDLFDYLDAIDSFRSYLTSSRVFNARQPKDRRKHYSFTDIIMMLDESISHLDMNRDSFSPGDFIYVLGVVPQAVSVLAEDVEDINSRIAGELRDLGRQLEGMVTDLRSGESDVDYLLNSLLDCMNTLVDFRRYLTSSRTRSSGFRQLSSGVKDSASIMEFCDYWELERDHRGILMDELDTDDIDEVFPWDTMLDAMNRVKVKNADAWYGGFTEYYDPVDFSEFIGSSGSSCIASSSDVDLDFAFSCLEDAEDLKRRFADAVAMQNRGREGEVGEERLLGFANSFVSEYEDIGFMSRTLPESAESFIDLESVITRTYSDYQDGRYDDYGVHNIYRAVDSFCTVLRSELG